jgi:ribulose-phosphate 3-epimerase
MIDIVPTAVPRDQGELAATMDKVFAFSDKIHLDINDGVFVSQVSWPYLGPDMYGSADITIPPGRTVQAHMMVSEPRALGLHLIQAGVTSIVGHIEACANHADAESMLAAWRAAGAREVGLAILINTPTRDIEPCIQWCDVVQVMSVATIGAQGAAFDPRAIERVREIRKAHPQVKIAVDGGVSPSNIGELIAAGASRFCVGSAIMQAPDPEAAFRSMLSATIS